MAIAAGSAAAKAGTRAALHAPVASTTVRHRQSPWSVATPDSRHRRAGTEVTAVWVRTGAATAAA